MKTVSLNSLTSLLESGSRPKGGVDGYSAGIPSLGGEHLDGSGGFRFDNIRWVPSDYFEKMDKGRIFRNDILIVKDGATTGKTSLVRGSFPFKEACINEHVFRLTVDPRLADSLYVFHYLNSQRGQSEILKDFRGATVGGITRSFGDKVLIPLPALEEQQRIAAILDKADAICRKRQKATVLSENMLPAIFVDLFGSTGSKYLSESLDRHLEFLTSGSRGWAEHYVRAGKRFIRSLDVQMNRIGSDDIVYVDPPLGAEADRTRVRDGDVLVTITGSRIGRVAFVPDSFGEAYVSQHVAIIRLKPSLRPRFCSMFLSLLNGGQRQIAKAQYGQTKPGLSLTNIREFQVPIPPLYEQDRFLALWDCQKVMSNRQASSNFQLNDLFDSLVHRAFRGELRP